MTDDELTIELGTGDSPLITVSRAMAVALSRDRFFPTTTARAAKVLASVLIASIAYRLDRTDEENAARAAIVRALVTRMGRPIGRRALVALASMGWPRLEKHLDDLVDERIVVAVLGARRRGHYSPAWKLGSARR